MDRIAKPEADSMAQAQAIEHLTVRMDQGFAQVYAEIAALRVDNVAMRADMRSGDAELRLGHNQLRAEMRAGDEALGKRIDNLQAVLTGKIERVHFELDRKTDLHLRWMIGLHASNMLAILGLYVR